MNVQQLQQILDVVTTEEPVIWQIVFPSLEPPSEKGRFLALASLARTDWLPAVVGCIIPSSHGKRELDEDGLNVNRHLMHFVAAFAARQPEPVFSILRPLLADEERRLFALEVLAEIPAYLALHETIPAMPFLLEFEMQAMDWTDVEYESYTHAFLSNGVAPALAAVQEIQSRLPITQTTKHAWLVRQIAHLRNFSEWKEAYYSVEEQQQQQEAGLRWLEKQGVLRIIQEHS